MHFDFFFLNIASSEPNHHDNEDDENEAHDDYDRNHFLIREVRTFLIALALMILTQYDSFDLNTIIIDDDLCLCIFDQLLYFSLPSGSFSSLLVSDSFLLFQHCLAIQIYEVESEVKICSLFWVR